MYKCRNSPVHEAVLRADQEAVLRLVSETANLVTEATAEGATPLHVAAKSCNVSIVQAIVDNPMVPFEVDIRSYLTGGSHNGQWGKKDAAGKIVRLENRGSTALHLAVQVLHDRKEAAEDEGEEARAAISPSQCSAV